MLTPDQVSHVAKLARLGLTDEEVVKFTTQLSSIFQSLEKLGELDTKNVPPTSQVTNLNNVLREDEVRPFSDREKLLACSPMPIQFDQILVPSVIQPS